jgi:hypothetical protein
MISPSGLLLVIPHLFDVLISILWVKLQKNDPLGGFLFVLAHYRALLKTITQAPSCVFPSLANDTHMMGPMSKIIPHFDHLSTQLALIKLKVKTLKCKLWNPSGISSSIEIH